MRACGQGNAGLENFHQDFHPLWTFLCQLLRATKSVAAVTMQDACDDLYAAEDAKTTIVNTAVCDDSWHRRGHSSLYGVVTVISMKNGKVLDVEAMSRVCKGFSLN